MYTRLITTFLAIFSIACISLAVPPNGFAADTGKYMVSAINTDINSDGFLMKISGGSVPAFTVTERFDPFRVVIDVAGAEFAETIQLEKILPDNLESDS